MIASWVPSDGDSLIPRNVIDRMSHCKGSLRSLAVVVIQHATKLLAAMDLAFRLAYFLAWVDQLVAQALMIPRTMITNQVSIHRVTQRVLTKEDHSSKALGLDAQVEAFQMHSRIPFGIQ